jgi:dihydrolipoamide dehydrogenase
MGRFADAGRMIVDSADGPLSISFKNAIIACGSSPTRIPGFPYDDPRLIDSTGALALEDIPERLLIVGGGIIGLEMATVYGALGSSIDMVEMLPTLIPGCDRDLLRPLQKRMAKQCNRIMLSTKVAGIEAVSDGLRAFFEGDDVPHSELYDKVLVAVGRTPNGGNIGAESAGVAVDQHGFIAVDGKQRTNVHNIYAVGDVTGGPMLAHKATHEAKVAAECVAGLDAEFGERIIPSVAYTEPEVAWAGLTESKAKERGIEYEKAAFPWAASGRAIGIGHQDGTTKLLLEPESRRVLGVGIVGHNAGELIGEAVLALELGATAEQIGSTVHPHPTLNETLCFAAELAEGTITDLMPPRKRSR